MVDHPQIFLKCVTSSLARAKPEILEAKYDDDEMVKDSFFWNYGGNPDTMQSSRHCIVTCRIVYPDDK
jgi:hypothetical protein